MLFLVELDHLKSNQPLTPEAGRTFIEQIILPTLARAEHFTKERKILAGGPVVGRITLQFIVEADSLQDVDRIVSSMPIWPVVETRVTPLIAFADRPNTVQALLEIMLLTCSSSSTPHGEYAETRRRAKRRNSSLSSSGTRTVVA